MTTREKALTISDMLRTKRGDAYQTEAARAIGVSRQIYDQWEEGYAIPGPAWVQPLGKYLGRNEAEIALILYHSWYVKNAKGTSPIIHEMTPARWAGRPIEIFAAQRRLRAA